MAVSVVEAVFVSDAANATTRTVTLTTTPQTGDYVFMVGNATGGLNIACSGLGATWALAAQDTTGIGYTSVVRVGTGATAAGSVTITSSSVPGTWGLLLVRGLPNTNVLFVDPSTYTGMASIPVGTTRQHPTVASGGGLALGLLSAIVHSPTIAYPASTNTGWTTADFRDYVGGTSAVVYQAVNAATTINLGVENTGSGTVSNVFDMLLLVGDATGALLDGQYVEALTVGTPAAAVEGQYVEALTTSTPAAVAEGQYVEVLTTSYLLGPYRDAVMADSPLAYWRLGEKTGTAIADSSGHGSNGQTSAGAIDVRGTSKPGLLVGDTDTAFWPGYLGGGSNGTNGDSISVTASGKPLDTGGGQNLAIELLVKFDSATTTTNQADWHYFIEQANSKFYFFWGNLGTGTALIFGYNDGSFHDHQMPWSPTAGVIYHLAVIKTSAFVTFYVNGSSLGSVASAGSVPTTSASTRLFARYAAPQYGYARAVVDEMAVYSSLSTSRLSAHYLAATTSTTLPSDNFNRADIAAGLGTSSSGHVWSPTSFNYAAVVSNQLQLKSGAVGDPCITLNAGVSDCTVQATLTGGLGADCSLVGRYSDDNNYWLGHADPTGAWRLFKRVAGSYTQINSTGPAVQAGDVAKLVFNGSSISLVVNGATVATTTDSFNLTATKAGFRVGNNGYGSGANFATSYWDDFSVTTGSSGGSTVLTTTGSLPMAVGATGNVWFIASGQVGFTAALQCSSVTSYATPTGTLPLTSSLASTAYGVIDGVAGFTASASSTEFGITTGLTAGVNIALVTSTVIKIIPTTGMLGFTASLTSLEEGITAGTLNLTASSSSAVVGATSGALGLSLGFSMLDAGVVIAGLPINLYSQVQTAGAATVGAAFTVGAPDQAAGATDALAGIVTSLTISTLIPTKFANAAFDAEGTLVSTLTVRLVSDFIAEGFLESALDQRNTLLSTLTGEGTLTGDVVVTRTLASALGAEGVLDSFIIGTVTKDIDVWYAGPLTAGQSGSGPDTGSQQASGPKPFTQSFSGPRG